MSAFVDALVRWRVPLLIVLGLVAVAAVVYVVWLLRRSREDGEGGESEASPEVAKSAVTTLARSAELELSFRGAMKRLREVSPGALAAYRQPWYLALGPVGAGTSSVLEHAPLARRLRIERGEASDRDPVGWHFFDEGVVLDVHGDLVQKADLTADDGSWKRLLALLRRHRADRPIDGIVLTLPAPKLLEWRTRPADELREIGASLFRRLQEAQTTLGVRFPVYVLLTRANELPGFSSFVRAIPRRFHQDPFGWSSPYALDTAFRKEWVDDAMGSIGDALRDRALEVLGARGFTQEADAVFRFPEVAELLTPATRAVLGEIFEDSAYHEAFFLRGIYLTGRVEVEDLPPASEEDEEAEVTTSAARSAFLGRLFSQKVFPERGLARTFRQGLLARNRSVRALQIAAMVILAVGIPGMWYGHTTISERSSQLEVLLDSVDANLARMSGAQGDGVTQFEGESLVNRLLRQMASVEGGPVRSAFLPTSWFSDLSDEVAENLTQAFPTVILPTIRRGIVEWPDTLTDVRWATTLGGRIPLDADESDVFVSERFQEYEVLMRYLSEIRQFAEAASQYNRLAEPGSDQTQEFARLFQWYYEEQLPAEVLDRDVLFGEALARAGGNRVSASNWRGFEVRAAEVASGLVARFYDRLTSAVRSLEAGFAGTADPTFSASDLRELYRDVREVEAVLTSADSTWLMPGGPVVPALQARLDSVPATPLVDRELFIRQFEQGFRGQRSAAIAELEAELNLLARSLPSTLPGAAGGSLRGTLGPALSEIRVALGDLVDRDFMAPLGPLPPAGPSDGIRSWDVTGLEEALGWFEEFRAYREGPLQEVPTSLRSRIDAVAVRALEERIRWGIARAMILQPADPTTTFAGVEAELQARLATFDQAARRLTGMLQIDAELGSSVVGDAVAETILLEAGDLLADLDLLLAEARIYVPVNGDFSAWNGERPVWAAAFGQPTPEELDAYLAAQRERLALLSGFASSLLAYMELPPVRRLLDREGAALAPETVRLQRKWMGIVTELQDHADAVAGNSVDALERFIREELSIRGVPGCPSVAEPETPARDWFLQVRGRLYDEVQRQCVVLARAALLSGYDRIRDFHTARLAGRFPFVDASEALSAPPAEVEAVRQFVELWDSVVAPLAGSAPQLVETLLAEELDPVAFERLSASTDFLRPLFVAPTEEEAPRLEVRPSFRVLREREQGGDQVVDWAIEVGGRTLTYRGRTTGQLLPWQIGDPVRVRLTWASQSPRRPSNALARTDFEASGAVGTFRYDGPWALLRLYAANRPDSRDRVGSRAEISATVNLRFVTRSVAALDESPDPDGQVASVFLRLDVRGLDGIFDAPVPIFPAQLPGR